MEVKRVVTLIAFVTLMIAGFLFYFVIYSRQPPIQGFSVKNGRDDHGCIEGYAWNGTYLSCIKFESGQIKYQVVDFQSCSDAGYAINQSNQTSLLQCYALNGSIFVQSAASANITENNKTLIYPDSFTLIGNFSISSNIKSNSTNVTNSTNSS